jgi:predicted small metal-binding protein
MDRRDGQEEQMRQFVCNDVVPGCTFVTRRDGEEELWAEIASHARDAHGMEEVPPEVAETIRGVITEV